MKEMNDDDRAVFWRDMCSVFMMVDCFDFLLAEINEIVARQRDTYVFDKFDGLLKLAKKSEFEMRKFGGEMTADFLTRFADSSDKLREEITKFAEKFIVKENEPGKRKKEEGESGHGAVRVAESA